MLAIRMQRVGRKKNAQYRVVAQESSRSPLSGKVVAQLGRFNPHTKEVTLDVPEIEKHIQNGAQPSGRVVSLLLSEGVKLPDWVPQNNKDDKKAIKNPEKLRKNQPEPEAVDEPAEPVEASTDNEPETTPEADEAEAEKQ